MPVVEIDNDENLKKVLLDNGEDKHGKKYIFVDFYATWCGPCKRFVPVLEDFSEKYNKNVHFVKVNVDKVENVTVDHDITCLPTFMVFDSGNLKSNHEVVKGAQATVVEEVLKKLQVETIPEEVDEDYTGEEEDPDFVVYTDSPHYTGEEEDPDFKVDNTEKNNE